MSIIKTVTAFAWALAFFSQTGHAATIGDARTFTYSYQGQPYTIGSYSGLPTLPDGVNFSSFLDLGPYPVGSALSYSFTLPFRLAPNSTTDMYGNTDSEQQFALRVEETTAHGTNRFDTIADINFSGGILPGQKSGPGRINYFSSTLVTDSTGNIIFWNTDINNSGGANRFGAISRNWLNRPEQNGDGAGYTYDYDFSFDEDYDYSGGNTIEPGDEGIESAWASTPLLGSWSRTTNGLTPVPLSAGLVFLLSGVSVLGFLARRRTRAPQ